MSKNKIKHIGGMELSVPAFYEGQNTNGTPDHYITRERFEQGKACGDIRPIHHGKTALIKAVPTLSAERAQSNPKSKWAILGQTKPGCAPGFPHYALV